MTFKISRSTLVLAPLVVTGCMTYSPQELSSMSGYSLCEIQFNQRPNLTDESKRALQSELDRRKDNCSSHLAGIRATRQEELDLRTYGMQSP